MTISDSDKQAVDRILEGSLDENAVDEIVDIVAGDETWPSVELVLYITTHSTVSEPMHDDELPTRLEEALSDAMEAILPMLGSRGYGPLYNHVRKAKRLLDREREKYEATARYLEAEDTSEAHADIIDRYLDTDPAPLFSSRLRIRFPSLFRTAEKRRSKRSRAGGAPIPISETMRTQLTSLDETSADVLGDEIEHVLSNRPITPSTLKDTLQKTGTLGQLAAAAIALYKGDGQYGPIIMENVLKNPDTIVQLTVIGSLLSPEVARNVFSQYLAEASMTSPGEDGAEFYTENSRAILAARCALAYLNEELDKVTEGDVPGEDKYESLTDLPTRIDRWWKVFESLGNDQ